MFNSIEGEPYYIAKICTTRIKKDIWQGCEETE